MQKTKEISANSTDKINGVELQPVIKTISALFRKNGISYNQSKYVFHEVRKACELESESATKRKLPEIPSDEEIGRLLSCTEKNYTHWLIIKFLLSTGLRISEFINIKCKDVFLDELKIFISISKTGNRFVLFPKNLKMHVSKLIDEKRSQDYLFTSRQYKKYSRHGVWWFIKKYATEAKIDKKLSPHSFRHYFLTKMSNIMNEAEVMVLSGHSRKDTLGIYQHMGIEDLREKYERVF